MHFPLHRGSEAFLGTSCCSPGWVRTKEQHTLGHRALAAAFQLPLVQKDTLNCPEQRLWTRQHRATSAIVTPPPLPHPHPAAWLTCQCAVCASECVTVMINMLDNGNLHGRQFMRKLNWTRRTILSSPTRFPRPTSSSTLSSCDGS